MVILLRCLEKSSLHNGRIFSLFHFSCQFWGLWYLLYQGYTIPRPQISTRLSPVKNWATQQKLSGRWVSKCHIYLQPLPITRFTTWTLPPVGSVVALDSHRSTNPCKREKTQWWDYLFIETVSLKLRQSHFETVSLKRPSDASKIRLPLKEIPSVLLKLQVHCNSDSHSPSLLCIICIDWLSIKTIKPSKLLHHMEAKCFH